MWVTKKKFQELEKRVSGLEKKIQGQSTTISHPNYTRNKISKEEFDKLIREFLKDRDSLTFQ